MQCPSKVGSIIEQIIIPKIKNDTTVVFGIFVFLINRKYTSGTVNNKSNVIPIDKLLGFVLNIFDFVMNTIIPIINNGIPKIIRYF